jgi:hypothetical protein
VIEWRLVNSIHPSPLPSFLSNLIPLPFVLMLGDSLRDLCRYLFQKLWFPGQALAHAQRADVCRSEWLLLRELSPCLHSLSSRLNYCRGSMLLVTAVIVPNAQLVMAPRSRISWLTICSTLMLLSWLSIAPNTNPLSRESSASLSTLISPTLSTQPLLRTRQPPKGVPPSLLSLIVIRNLEFQAGWYADPVFFGHYPQSMVEAIGDRLPTFTAEQSERIKGSYDFYGALPPSLHHPPPPPLLILPPPPLVSGLNHYTSKYATDRAIPSPSAGWSDDQATTMTNTDSSGNLIGPQAASSWFSFPPVSPLHDPPPPRVGSG